jgi:uncharacterized BrkB/YihY/UPF0761 family membrane protein
MIKWFNQRPVRPLWTAVRRLLRRYRRHGVAFSCAALTYYLVFAAFPLLVLLAAAPLGYVLGNFFGEAGAVFRRIWSHLCLAVMLLLAALVLIVVGSNALIERRYAEVFR